MTREETREARKVMQHFEDGGEVECAFLGVDEWRDIKDPIWDWRTFNYRIKNKIKVTKDELEEMQHIGKVWVKFKHSGAVAFERPWAINKNNYYFLNPDTMEWEDRGDTYEKEKLRHHYNGGQP